MSDALKERKQIMLTFRIYLILFSRWHNIDKKELFNSQCQDATSGGCGQKDRTGHGGVTFCSRSIMTSRPSVQASSSTNLAAIADPPIRQIDGAAMDYFLIELVATLRESAAVATARSKKVEQEMLEAGLIPPPVSVPSSIKKEKDSSARDSVTSLASKTGSAVGGKSVVDEEEEAVRQRLETIGMHVGANFSERSASLCISIHFIN